MDDDVYWTERSDYSMILLKIVDPSFYDEIANYLPRREQFLISAVSQIFMLLAEPQREQVVALPPPAVCKICSYDKGRIINIFFTRDLRPAEARRLFFARSSIFVQGYQVGMEIGSLVHHNGSYISRSHDTFYQRARIYIGREGCFRMSTLVIHKIFEDFFFRPEKPEDDLARQGTELWRDAFNRFGSRRLVPVAERNSDLTAATTMPVAILGRGSDLTGPPTIRY
jgi:hypothetical protein